MSTFLLCDRCREPITQLEEGGWQVRGEKREGWYGHWGPLCPKDYPELWDAIFQARFAATVASWESDTGLVDPEVPVEPVPQSL